MCRNLWVRVIWDERNSCLPFTVEKIEIEEAHDSENHVSVVINRNINFSGVEHIHFKGTTWCVRKTRLSVFNTTMLKYGHLCVNPYSQIEKRNNIRPQKFAARRTVTSESLKHISSLSRYRWRPWNRGVIYLSHEIVASVHAGACSLSGFPFDPQMDQRTDTDGRLTSHQLIILRASPCNAANPATTHELTLRNTHGTACRRGFRSSLRIMDRIRAQGTSPKLRRTGIHV